MTQYFLKKWDVDVIVMICEFGGIRDGLRISYTMTVLGRKPTTTFLELVYSDASTNFRVMPKCLEGHVPVTVVDCGMLRGLQTIDSDTQCGVGHVAA